MKNYIMNIVRVMSWNIRGVNNSTAKRNCRELVVKNKPNIVCLQETKSENWAANMRRYFLCKDKYEMCFQPSRGNSGGLAMFWDIGVLRMVALAQSQNWMWLTFEVKAGGHKVHLVNIYSPLAIEGKKLLWEELGEILGCVIDEPICFIGDFNCIRSSKERMNCVYARRDVADFNSMIDNNNLLDIGMLNAKFTWFGHGNKKSRLDRVLVDVTWAKCAEWKVQALSKKHSDHKALLLFCDRYVKSHSPFRIFNCHITESLLEAVREHIVSQDSWPTASSQQILKSIRSLVKEMSQSGSNNIDSEIAVLENKMSELEEDNWGAEEHLKVRGRLMEMYVVRYN